MKEFRPFSLEEVLTEDLLALQRSKENDIKNRHEDIFSSGIVSPKLGGFYSVPFNLVLNVVNTKINVRPGVAYDDGIVSVLNTEPTQPIVGAERIEIFQNISLSEAVPYDSDWPANTNFSNTLNLQDTNSAFTPLSTGNYGISLADYTLDVVNYFYIVYYQTVELTNLLNYLGGVPAIIKSTPDTLLGFPRYPYKRNGYAVFVSTTPPTSDGTLPVSTFSGLFTDPTAILGSKAFFIGKVAAFGAGNSLVNRIINEGTFSLGDPLNLRKLYRQNPKSVGIIIPNSANPVDPLDPEKTQAGQYDPTNAELQPTLDSHIRALGTNTTGPTELNPHNNAPIDFGAAGIVDIVSHRQDQHSNGITTINYQDLIDGKNTLTKINASALFCSIDPGNPQQILIRSLIGASTTGLINISPSTAVTNSQPEEAYVGGQRLIDTNLGILAPLTRGNITAQVSTPATTTAALIFKLLFSSPSNLPVGNYIIFLRSDGKIDVILDGTDSFPLAPISFIKLATFRVSTLAGTAPTFVQDLRVFGTTGGKDTQDSSITSNKINIEVRKVNSGVFQYKTAKKIQLTGAGIKYSMDGFYSKWLNEGFINQGTLCDGRVLSIPASSIEATLPDVGATAAGTNLDTGKAVAENWYAVFAVEDLTNPGKFALRFTTMVHCNPVTTTQIAASGQRFITAFNQDYNWGTDYTGGQLIALTGKDGGTIFNIVSSANGSASILNLSAAMTETNIFWAMLAPAPNSANMVGLNAKNYRYIGAVYLTPTGAGGSILRFSRVGNRYDQDGDGAVLGRSVAGAVGVTPLTPFSLTSNSVLPAPNRSLVPPTAIAVSGRVDVANAPSTRGAVGLSGDGVTEPIRIGGIASGSLPTFPYTSLSLSLLYEAPYSSLSLLGQQTATIPAPNNITIWISAVGTTSAAVRVTGWEE